MHLKADTLLQGDKYRIISTLGQGGFGITYLAEQVLVKRKVCIKEFFPKEYYKRNDDSSAATLMSDGFAESMNRFKAKFIKEAQTIAALDHPNIIHIFEIFEENGTAYYVMEYVEGESLSDKVKRSGAMDEAEAIGYIHQVTEALGYIHSEQIMHLDVKPANVMVRSRDNRAILIDFGLSKHYDTASGEATSTTPVGVSHGFAPMEQYKDGGVSTFSPETDIYSLGATLYYLVVGKVPPQAADVANDGLPELPAHLSESVKRTIDNAMQSRRGARPQSIEAFMAILKIGIVNKEREETIPIQVEKQSQQVNVKTKPSNKTSNKRWGIWVILLVIITAGVSVMLFTQKESVAPTQESSIPIPPNDEIWYTSVDDQIVASLNKDIYGANIISNTYENGKGVIKFDRYITAIGSNAFEERFYLTSITLPNSITSIGVRAFSNCPNLTNVYIGDGVTLINDYAFNGCLQLDNVTIPNSVTTIGNSAFSKCHQLGNITIGENVRTIGDYAFSECHQLESVIIPNSVTTIGNSAFSECHQLESVTIPNSVTTIGNSAFSKCHQLGSITIGENVRTIGDYAFSECHLLESVTIPNSVSRIEDYAFSHCMGLKSIYCKAVTPPSYYYLISYDNVECKIFVPNASVEAYKDNFGWSQYADQIVGYDFEM